MYKNIQFTTLEREHNLSLLGTKTQVADIIYFPSKIPQGAVNRKYNTNDTGHLEREHCSLLKPPETNRQLLILGICSIIFYILCSAEVLRNTYKAIENSQGIIN